MADDRLSVGVDLGGTNLRAALVGPDGVIRAERRERVGQGTERQPAFVLQQTAALIRGLVDEAAPGPDGIRSIGVGVAGQVRGESGIIASAPNLAWREVPFGPELARALGRPVRLVNDLDAIAWAEARFGAARGHRHVLVVFCGTGVGGGLVLGGRPHHGAAGVAGEIGHVKVAGPDGLACGCGARGCLEAYLGGRNLSARLVEEAAGPWPALARLAGGASIHPGMVEQLLEAGDARAEALWTELSALFGTVLANAASLLNLSAIVLGGTVLRGCPDLHRRVRAVVRQRVLAVAGETLALLEDGLGDRAGIIGAACLDQASERID